VTFKVISPIANKLNRNLSKCNFSYTAVRHSITALSRNRFNHNRRNFRKFCCFRHVPYPTP